ncbi:hypothetical protein POM88_049942 [Heracleum sosnowskyi]|uniref:Sugar phosphate transporter domain-containing protein n=1 Tax=Heracleum sosnowskyi TaxID=360622 RepID=A0AAD8M106_9APIA|nr:hypothetical protein POM88_049942 [Heracleum sosnowskyi]
MVTILKNVTNILTAIGELYIFRKLQNQQVWAAMFLMIIFAITGGITDLTFDSVGYAWQFSNYVLTASYTLDNQVPEYGTGVDFNIPDTTRCPHRQDVAKGGTVSAVSVAGAIGVGAGIWVWKKVREKVLVTHGVQNNENRLF